MAGVRRILVATDFSAGTHRALAYASELAEHLGAELHLLHIVPVHTFPLPTGRGPEERLRDARQRLERIALPVSLGRLGVVCEVRAGRPAEEVVRYAREMGAGFIALSTHGRTGLSHALMGSGAEQVIRTAPCPVLTVRTPSSTGHHADLSEAAWRLAFEFGTELDGDRLESWEKMSPSLMRELDLGPAEAARRLALGVWESILGEAGDACSAIDRASIPRGSRLLLRRKFGMTAAWLGWVSSFVAPVTQATVVTDPSSLQALTKPKMFG